MIGERFRSSSRAHAAADPSGCLTAAGAAPTCDTEGARDAAASDVSVPHAAEVATLDVEHLVSMTVATARAPEATLRRGPQGTSVVVAATGGTFQGQRLRGRISPPAATGSRCGPTALSSSTCDCCS